MEPSKEAIAVRITRLNRQIIGKVTAGVNKFNKRTIDREALLDALAVLYDECNDDPVKKVDELVRTFVDKYRSTLAELRRTRVCIADFEILQTIGRGHFGEVHMVREKQTGDVYALKTLRKELARKRVAGAEDERDVLANANVPWIPKLQYAFQDNCHLYLVMELCTGGDLAGLIGRRNNPLSERDAAFYVAEVAHALKALHGMGYVHRDVKPHNIFLDRCGHVKLGDFGSCGRLSDGSCSNFGAATPDYVAPEILAANDCASNHKGCAQYCRNIVSSAISACDYWSLGVIAFELVTLRRPFSTDEDDSVAKILGNIQKYERDSASQPPFEPFPDGPSKEWRSLVAGLLKVQPSKRFNYLDTLQHSALSHLSLHNIRDQAPAWVPHLRGPEDASYFAPPPREPPPPSAAPFRTRPPFAGQLPFVGYSYVAPDESEDQNSGAGFNASHDCTAIDLKTFKSSEKLAAMRAREIAALQAKLIQAEAEASANVERAKRNAQDEEERIRAKLQGEITALSLQNKRLERQVEVEKEERMALQRANQELSTSISDRNSLELKNALAQAAKAESERDELAGDVRRLEERVRQLEEECTRAQNTASQQQMHYKDTIAKERALRRQTLSGGEAESREFGARIAAAEANVARETRAKELAEKKALTLEAENNALRAEIEEIRKEFSSAQESLNDRIRQAELTQESLREAQQLLAQEKVRSHALSAQVQELERSLSEASTREAAVEEQGSRTEARLRSRLEDAEQRAAAASELHTRHREKVNTLEQLVRQLEREVSALEKRTCPECEARKAEENKEELRKDSQSDTESLADANNVQVIVLKEQLERAEAQLQARANEIAMLRQEARAANLARWRKEREFNDLSLEAKATERELKSSEERLKVLLEAKQKIQEKATALLSEMSTLKPDYERAKRDADRYKEQCEKLQKSQDIMQAEIDRSRNDIRKLKSELQYSERRRMHAEEQEELSSKERCQLRDELMEVRCINADLVKNNKALQEACTVLEDQLNDLETLADHHEVKNKDLEKETLRLRCDLESCRARLLKAEREAMEKGHEAALVSKQNVDTSEHVHALGYQLQMMNERLENRETRIAQLESRIAELETEFSGTDSALNSAMRRVRELQEESSALRTRAHEHHSHALKLQASLAEAQEELSSAREAAEAAAAWWRTRETKAEATLRQQAKLIDFLQAKLEEMNRKKHSLSNKLFGRSGRRAVTSPSHRKANRELREEVERLRAKLAAFDKPNSPPLSGTPMAKRPSAPEMRRHSSMNGKSPQRKSIDTPDGAAAIQQDETVQVVWADGSREKMQMRVSNGDVILSGNGRETKGRLLSAETNNLPYNEAHRAFTITVDAISDRGSTAGVVCGDAEIRGRWLRALGRAARGAGAGGGGPGYTPVHVLVRRHAAKAACLLAGDAAAVGYSDGLHSSRGPIQIEIEDEFIEAENNPVSYVGVVNGRVIMSYGSYVIHSNLASMRSALRRSAALCARVPARRLALPHSTPSPKIVTSVEEQNDGPCLAIACGRRVFLLKYDGASVDFRIVRSITIDREPSSMLLTANALYIAGEKPLKINLPAGALETFALDDLTVAAAAKKHSPPTAILLLKHKPKEILLCYEECGVFVDEFGKRTRNEDPKWTNAVKAWEYVRPFLYLIGDDKITILYVTEEVYKIPPCTCDTNSLTSGASEFYTPEIYKLKISEPTLIGTSVNGIIVCSKSDEGYSVSVVEGLPAFRSVGASVESLETISDSSSNAESMAEQQPETFSPQNASQESVETNTGFLADIRKRAKQLRMKNTKQDLTGADEVIKKILTAEVGLKRTNTGRKSPAYISDSETETDEEKTETSKATADLYAEMFARQVRFQN